MPHCAPPHSRNASCRYFIFACTEIPSMVTTVAPFACATGTRQLFTSIPSNKTEHEPHSPSPHPSFVPVNFKSFRSTSRSLSIGRANTFFTSPLTENEISYVALVSGKGFMPSLSPKRERLVQVSPAPRPQTNLPAATESHGFERQSHPRRRL